MNHKAFETWVSSVFGVFGFGITWTSMNLADAVPKIMLSATLALLGGYMGYLGKLVGVWSIKKVKAIIHRIKTKQS